MDLTEKEKMVLDYLTNVLDDDIESVAYSEMESDLTIDSKVLRGVISSLVKKKMITHDFEKDADVSFIGIR